MVTKNRNKTKASNVSPTNYINKRGSLNEIKSMEKMLYMAKSGNVNAIMKAAKIIGIEVIEEDGKLFIKEKS